MPPGTEAAVLAHAAQQAWVGFWRTCMADVGAVSRLDFDVGCLAPWLQVPSPTVLPSAMPGSNRTRSELAAALEGDGRISDITIRDVLVGLEDYFTVFRKLRRYHPDAYGYFRRVGAPLCLERTSIWRDALVNFQKPIINPADLPAYIGVFFARDREEYRKTAIEDGPSLMDFHLYEKRRRNIAVVAPWKWTIYDHTLISLERDVFTRSEHKKYKLPGMFGKPWGFHYFIGINNTDGAVAALPMHMPRVQALKNGGAVHHNNFVVPPGLSEISPYRTAHEYVAMMFAVIRNFCASALSGAQLSVRRDNEVVRFGVPLSNVKAFFRDRDKEGRRRAALLHYVGDYEYERSGRTVTVGEHLRGARRFRWRDYDISISAPGIHHPSPEALTAEVMQDDDILPLPTRGVMPIPQVAAMLRMRMDNAPKVAFRHGQPTTRYVTPTLAEAASLRDAG